MLTLTPLNEPPTFCKDCEFSFPISGRNSENLYCCVMWNTHVFQYQVRCDQRDMLHGEALAEAIDLHVPDWLDAWYAKLRQPNFNMEQHVRNRRNENNSTLARVPNGLTRRNNKIKKSLQKEKLL